jgi:AbrB family looped-hinge helix DNA binding protein
MRTTRVSSKGQVVLPKTLREELDWPPGTDLTIEKGNGSVVLRRKMMLRPTTIDEVVGSLKYDGPPVTLEDMERAIEEELAERWRRKSG